MVKRRPSKKPSKISPGQNNVWRRWFETPSNYLKLVVTVAGIISALWFFVPHLEISPAVAITSNRASGVDFTIKNVGAVEVLGVMLKCEIESRGRRLVTEGNVAVNMPHNPGTLAQYIVKLPAGEAITRSCDLGVGLPDVGYPATFDITARYRWAFTGWNGASTKRFSSRKDAENRILIVPDAR